MRWTLLLAVSLVLVSCRPRFEKEITTDEVRDHITYLASDELKGRYPGTPEDALLEHYIATELKHEGLILYDKTGLQSFGIVTDIQTGPGNRLSFDHSVMVLGEDFRPMAFSSSDSAEAEVIFAGYGFQIDSDDLTWDDYAPVDVSGKWVMILRGVPGEQEASSPYINFSEDRGKALTAADEGAAGVILVSGQSFDPGDQLEALSGKQPPLTIPVVHMTRAAADRFLLEAGADSVEFYERRITDQLQSLTFPIGAEMAIAVDLEPKEVKSANVLAILKGSDPALKDQYVIVGAHHDHLGMGGEGSSSRRPDTIAVHYGADDNASGVAGVLEISEKLVADSPRRSILFATFGAEEMGLVGSKYLVEHPPIDLSEVQAMINLDMIGRLNTDRQLQIGGVGTSPGFEALLDSLNKPFGFNLKFSNEGYGPSDHASFYAHDIPVIFISTGGHPDYHTPDDNLEGINMEGAREVMQFAALLAESLANENEKIAFTEAGPKVQGSSRSRRGGITLGLMPDVTYDGNDGMPVMFVTKGKPAAVGGIQKGDVIVAIEGKSVGNVYDYMSRLDQLKEGMSIIVTVRRGTDLVDLVIRL
ncbi:MAG: M20/M25/M40 family metallo-hydrolase [Bacteroidales bacterium]